MCALIIQHPFYSLCVIGSTLFGGAYSGLEYDYRGVKKCYQRLEEADKVLFGFKQLQLYTNIQYISRPLHPHLHLFSTQPSALLREWSYSSLQYVSASCYLGGRIRATTERVALAAPRAEQTAPLGAREHSGPAATVAARASPALHSRARGARTRPPRAHNCDRPAEGDACRSRRCRRQ